LRDRLRRYLLVSVGTIFRTDTYRELPEFDNPFAEWDAQDVQEEGAEEGNDEEEEEEDDDSE
jgi:hypothetical protein